MLRGATKLTKLSGLSRLMLLIRPVVLYRHRCWAWRRTRPVLPISQQSRQQYSNNNLTFVMISSVPNKLARVAFLTHAPRWVKIGTQLIFKSERTNFSKCAVNPMLPMICSTQGTLQHYFLLLYLLSALKGRIILRSIMIIVIKRNRLGLAKVCLKRNLLPLKLKSLLTQRNKVSIYLN